MTVTYGSDTVGAKLALTIRREKVHQADQDTQTEDSGRLQHRNRIGQVIHDKEERGKAVKTLRSGQTRQDDVVTEGIRVLLHRTDCGIARDSSTIATAYGRQSKHDGHTEIAQRNRFHKSNFVLVVNIDYHLVYSFFNGVKTRVAASNPAFL